MNTQQIEKFIDAGYTKEEINLLFKNPKVDPENVENEKNDTEKDKNAQDHDKDTTSTNVLSGDAQINEMTKTIKSLTDTVNSLADTVKALQNNNIDNAKTDNNKQNTINDVMKSFVEKL